MANYLSEIKLPSGDTYKLKDSEKTDEKVKQTANTEDKEFPIILKNTNNTTNETNGVKYAGGVTVNPSEKTVTATEFIGNIKANRVQPTVVKNWTSTSFYGANISGQDVHDLSTFWMLSVKPDSWYEPWVVRFKITTTCPAAANYYSVTYCMYSGRADGIVVFNWNERYDHAHYYTNIRTLKKAGFDAGLGHAIGINLYASNNYTNANYYRSFKLEYYDCDNCTVTILDTPVKWANWSNGTTTNYNGNNNANAVDRGLQESGDANSYDLLQMSNNYIKNGAFRFPGISMFGYDREGHAQAFSLYQSGYTSYTASASNKETRIYNTNGIDWTRGIHYNASGGSWAENADMNITTRLAQSAVDLRYTDNCVSTAGTTISMVTRKAVYIRGTLDDNGLFHVAPMDVSYNGGTYCRTWTQDIPTQVDNYVYWFIGYPYYTSPYQVNLYVENPLYWFHNGHFEEYNPPVVEQIGTSEAKDYPILLKYTNDTDNEINYTKYSNNVTADATATKPFTFNPSTGNLTVTQLKIGTKNDNMGLFPNLNNWNQIGSGSLYWYRAYINNYYGGRSHVDNWDSGKNIGTAATSSAAAVLGTVNFYNTAAAGATQTKTLLTADSTTNSNITITLPKTTGTLALKSELPTLSGLGGIGTISASGTAPLTLSGSKSGTTYTLTGSIADASASASGIINTDAQTFAGRKTFKYTTRIYPQIGATGEKSKWYKITFPYYDATTSSSAKWFMNSFDLHFGGGYQNNPSGVAHVTFYWTRAANNGAWTLGQGAAHIEGILANKIIFYYRVAEPGILYVCNNENAYNGIWLDNLYVDDTSPSLDWSTTKIETTSAITANTNPALSAYTVLPATYLYNDADTLKTDGNFEGKYIKGTWLYTSAATAKTSTAKLATIESDNFIYYITPANALKSAVGTTAIGGSTTPIYWDGSVFQAGTALSDGAYKSILNNTSKGALGWNSGGNTNADNLRLINVNTLAYWNGAYSGTSSNLSVLGTITTGTWNASVIGAAYGGTGQNTLQKSANALINALDTGSSDLTANDYVITQYVGGGTTTTSYHRRPASKVINATLVKTALGTNSTHGNAFLRKDGTWQTPPYPVTSVATLTGAITASDLVTQLGLSKAMRFIGIATKAISDGGTEDPTISGYSTKTAGDVIIDKDTRREYVWSTAGKWEMLGFDASAKYEKTTSGNTFISKITQATDGTVTAESRALDTSGTWSGNAATATTATNLANNPSIQASTSNTNQVTITAGGKTSSAYTIPYATSAGSATSATTATYIKCTDTRSTALNPTDLNAAQGIRFDFKAKGTINLTATDAYAGVMSFRPYASNSDWSGGNAHQIAFNSEGLHWRNGGASWDNWYQILDSNNTSAAKANGTAVSVTCGTDATLATINDVAVKINVTKPTYTYSDVGAAAANHGTHVTAATVKSALNTGSDTTKFLNNKGDWAVPAYTTSLAWSAITSKPNLSIGNARIFYGTSSTAAGTAAKVVTCSIYDAYTAGDILVVKFDNANTAGSPTLNVNSKGAKNIRKIYNGAVNTLNANGEITGTCMFVYDGTQWLLTNADYNNTYTIPTSFSITANATDGLWDLTGTNGTNAVTYALAPYSSKGTTATFYTAATNPTLTTRLNYDGYLYATKLYSGGTEVSVSGHTHSYLSSISWSGDANLKLKQSVNGAAATDVLQFAAGSNITLTGASGKLTIAGTPDTKNTAGSTNSDSKLYLIGAASQAANPQTYSDAHVFETNGAFSAKTLGVNADTDADKVTLQWNSTDSSLEFVFA